MFAVTNQSGQEKNSRGGVNYLTLYISFFLPLHNFFIIEKECDAGACVIYEKT